MSHGLSVRRLVPLLAILLAPLSLAGPAAAATAPTAKVPAAATAAPRAYVADFNNNTVDVIDTGTNTVIAIIPVGNSPGGVATTPDSATVYVTNFFDNTVSVIDAATDTVTATIPVGSIPTAVAVAPDGKHAYVANQGDNTVSVIDTATNTVTATIAVGNSPVAVAITPDSRHAYVANSSDNTVSVIDLATNTVTATKFVGSQPSAVAVAPDGKHAYVTNQNDNTVSVIDTATNTVIATIPVGSYPSGVVVTNTDAYVTNTFDNTVSVIDTATNTVVNTIANGGTYGIAVTPDGATAYVAGPGTVVTVDNLVTDTVTTIIGINGGISSFPMAVAVAPAPPGKPTPNIATRASAGNLLGAPVHDTATVSGGSSPTGSVTFQLFSDAACATQVFTSTNPLGAGTATSDTFTPTAAGTYRFIASYSGDANNNPATSPCGAANESVVIAPFTAPTPTRTITGDFLGPLTVNAGESVLLTNARVVGPVTVNPGAALTVVNSQISRGIVANAPSFFSVCGSQVSGPSTTSGQGLVVSNAAVPIRIGDPANGCAFNRVAGDVSLTGNSAGLTLGANFVSGNVTVNNNTVGTDVIKANNIFKALACAGNTPAPTNTGQTNTAGSKSGQCAAL